MPPEHKAIICDISNIAGTNEDIFQIIKRICFIRSDKNYDNLLDTYEYLKKHNPDDLEMFMSTLKYTALVKK